MPNFVNYFEFGHDIGWHLDDLTHSAQFVNCGVDGIVVDPATIGVQINGLANRNKWYGGFWSIRIPLFQAWPNLAVSPDFAA